MLKAGATELFVERSVLGIRWRRQRISASQVKKLRLGWLRGEELKGDPPTGFRRRHLPTLLRVRRHLSWLQVAAERRSWPAVRLELRDGALVPVAAARTAPEAEALAADLARRLNTRVVGASLLSEG